MRISTAYAERAISEEVEEEIEAENWLSSPCAGVQLLPVFQRHRDLSPCDPYVTMSAAFAARLVSISPGG